MLNKIININSKNITLVVLSFFIAQISAYAGANNASPPLIFGLLPSESAVTKFKRYAPLRDYLSTKLNRKVHLETARDFPEFLRRTKKGRYDFLETAPHFVIPAIDSKKYTVISTIIQPLSAQIVVLEKSKHKNLFSLAGLSIATPSPKAIITKIGKATVKKALPESPAYKTYKTHNAAYESVISHQTDAAIISVNVYNKAIDQNKPLKSIAESRAIPNMSILVSAQIAPSLKNKLQSTLVNMRNTSKGKSVLKKISYPGYRKTNAAEFEALRRYIK